MSQSGSQQKRTAPLPLFDSLEFIHEQEPPSRLTDYQRDDFKLTKSFLLSYIGSKGTFNSYRRDTERLLHWSWWICDKSITELKREDIEDFVRFCIAPPKSWIGLKKPPKFKIEDAYRKPNAEWRPFVATLSKADHKAGVELSKDLYELSQGAIKELFAVLSTYFNFLLQEEYVFANPVALIRQKSKFIQKQQSNEQIRRLSDTQWQAVVLTAKKLAKADPESHERTLFIMSALYSLYLRISELAVSERWSPQMNHFHKDSDGLWWFTTVGKGNKKREIAVSESMLNALKRWRTYKNLTPLPTIRDASPLLPKISGRGGLSSTSHIREIVQLCFDKAEDELRAQGEDEEADALSEATVHWLRHTGISDDVKHRPREHVRDDAGHGSSATTDRYIDIEKKERHRSASLKKI